VAYAAVPGSQCALPCCVCREIGVVKTSADSRARYWSRGGESLDAVDVFGTEITPQLPSLTGCDTECVINCSQPANFYHVWCTLLFVIVLQFNTSFTASYQLELFWWGTYSVA